MVKQGSGAHEMRNRENEAGPLEHSKVQAHQRKASGGMATQIQGNARRAQKRVEVHHAGQGSETMLWEYRCPELGFSNWTKRLGSINGWDMGRTLAANIDHDEARIIAFGCKKYTLELRRFGSTAIERYEISGFPVWKYVANRVN